MVVDMDHLHHRLLKQGSTQRRVAWTLYIANAFLVGVGVLSTLFHSHAVGIFLLAFLAGAYVIVRHVAYVELWDSGRALVQGLRRPPSQTLVVLLYPVLDFLALTACLGVALWLGGKADPELSLRNRIILNQPVWVTFPFLGLFMAKTYSRVWSRARVSEYAFLIFAVLGGVLVSASVASFLNHGSYALSAAESGLYGFAAAAVIISVRVFPRFVHDLTSLAHHLRPLAGEVPKSLVIYGAGGKGILYLRQYPRLRSAERLIGFIDDDTNLRGRLIHGHKVVGGVSDLVGMMQKGCVDKVLIATELAPETQKRLRSIARSCNVELSLWLPQERVLEEGHYKDPLSAVNF